MIVQVPASVRMRLMRSPPLPGLGCKQWAEPGPPEAHRLVAYIDAALGGVAGAVVAASLGRERTQGRVVHAHHEASR